MRYLIILLTLATAAACTVPARAEVAIPAKLTVADAVALALSTSVDLKQAQQTREAALSNLKIASFRTSVNFGSNTSFNRAGSNSDLSGLVFGKLNYENLSGTQATLDLTPLGIGTQHGAFGVTLRQALRKGQGILSNKGFALKSAQSDLSIQSKELFLSQQGTVQGVVEAYYQAVLAREEVKVREQAVKNAEIAADGWRKREEAGIAAGIDVTRSDVQVSQTKNALNSQQRNARNALDQLMIAIGGGVGQTPELVDSVPTVDVAVPSLGDAIKAALENRAELSVRDEQLLEQERQLALAKDQLRPQFDLVAGFNGSRDSEGLLSRSIFNSGQFTTGVEYNIPLDRRIGQEKYTTTARQLDVLRDLRDFQTEQITEQVRTAYRRMESARSALDILAQNKIAAEDNLRIANRMMEVGKGSSRDILDAQLSVTEVDSSLLSAKTDFYLATIDLKRAVGEDITTMEFK